MSDADSFQLSRTFTVTRLNSTTVKKLQRLSLPALLCAVSKCDLSPISSKLLGRCWQQVTSRFILRVEKLSKDGHYANQGAICGQTHKMVIPLGPSREEGYHIDVLLLEDSSFSARLNCLRNISTASMRKLSSVRASES